MKEQDKDAEMVGRTHLPLNPCICASTGKAGVGNEELRRTATAEEKEDKKRNVMECNTMDKKTFQRLHTCTNTPVLLKRTHSVCNVVEVVGVVGEVK